MRLSNRQLDARIACFVLAGIVIAWYAFYRGELPRACRHAAWNVQNQAQEILRKQHGSRIPAADQPVRFSDGRPIQCPLTKSPFIWKTKPFTAESFAKAIDNDVPELGGAFYACSATATFTGYRCFVFPGPSGGVILKDDQVDWKTQMQLD